jgi:cytochrome c
MTGLLRAALSRPIGVVLPRAAALALLAMLGHPLDALAAGDASHGAQVYKTCGICHAFDRNGAGPRHQGVVGRTAGTVADYRYSPALQKSGIVWTDETLDKWLADPQALVPGSKMFFAVDDAKDRADVIQFLKEKGGGPEQTGGDKEKGGATP